MAGIRFYKPALFRKDMDAVLQTMVDEKIGPGERKREYIRLFSSYIGKKDGFALRSYFDAIVYSLSSLGLEKGDKVFISVLSPRIYLEAFKELELVPVILDVDDDMMIDTNLIKENLTEDAKAIVYYEPICQLPREIEPILEFGLPIIEDVSQSIGSTYKDIKCGQIGNIVISSTEEDGVVSTGGGAIVLSSSDSILENLKKDISRLGGYIELPDMNAALGIVQIQKLDSVLIRRNTIYKGYIQSIMKTKCKPFGSGAIDFFANGYGFAAISNSRPDDTIAFAQKYHVSAKKTFSNAIGARYQDRFDRFPKAIPALTRAVSFPIYPFLSQIDIETVQKVISHLH